MSQLASENVVVSAPFSFNGSALRIWRITRVGNGLVKWLLMVPAALMLIMLAWMFVMCWYVVIYGLLGIFFIPYRLIRRSGRKQKRDKLRHRELLEAMQQNKQ
jgi:hypothetical protein